MLPQAVLLAVTWYATALWLRAVRPDARRAATTALVAGLLGALALIIYVSYLASNDPFYEIMRRYGLPLEEAGLAKKQGGLPDDYEPEVLDPFIDDMTQQVSRSLQFYLASGGGREQPDMILVCGGCANIPGIADVISSRVGIPTEVGDPLGQMKISSKAKSQGVNKDATALLTACGLALRSFD